MKKLLILFCFFASMASAQVTRFYDSTNKGYVLVHDASSPTPILFTKGGGYIVSPDTKYPSMIHITQGNQILYSFWRSSTDTPSSVSVRDLCTQITGMLSGGKIINNTAPSGVATSALQSTGNSIALRLAKKQDSVYNQNATIPTINVSTTNIQNSMLADSGTLLTVASTTTQLKASSGIVYGVYWNGVSGSTIKIYNQAGGTANAAALKISILATIAGYYSFPFGINFNNGIMAITGATANPVYTVVWK